MATPVDYVLQLADNALVLGQRNAEWCGHGPALEEDIAMANISLDLVGQARLLYQHAAQLLNAAPATQPASWPRPATEDSLAYLREPQDFRNYTLLELPHFDSRSGLLAGTARDNRDYATTIARNFLFGALMLVLWERLQESTDAQIAAIAAKSWKETRYHWRHSRDWLIRMGDGTEASHNRIQSALGHLMPYTLEFWSPSEQEGLAVARGIGVDANSVQPAWNALVDQALKEATLIRPQGGGFVTQGKTGRHSEHLGYLLDEMQSLARRYPQAVW